ncbi:hypothetical protein QBC47DRAFT_100216 [Echria macrotheca]|uniref:Uncharacterized protein n=1 Tax=Echria macrotheca TaxID=438768 RepID=A0AAJ0BLC8_9PEZI|nr:hypothetical protein QBC47DRAFT_100216 [Echria macrotheca]
MISPLLSILSLAVFSRLGLAGPASAARGDTATTTTTTTTQSHCDEACHLLKLIRYREAVNTDWLMAVGFCASLVRAEHYAPRLELEQLTVSLDQPQPVSTTTVTESVAATARSIGGRDYGRLDGDVKEQVCARYWATHKVRPCPSVWLESGYGEDVVRRACARLLPWHHHRGDGDVDVEFVPAGRVPVALVLSEAGRVVVTSTVVVTDLVVGDLGVEERTTTSTTTVTTTRTATRTVTNTEGDGDGGGFRCAGLSAECCTATSTADGAVVGLGCLDNTPATGPAVCETRFSVSLCCVVVAVCLILFYSSMAGWNIGAVADMINAQYGIDERRTAYGCSLPTATAAAVVTPA